MNKSTSIFLLTAAALILPSAAQAQPRPQRPAPVAKLTRPERTQQKVFLKSQVNTAKDTVARGKPVLKQARVDSTNAAKQELATRRARLQSKARYEAAMQEYRATGTPAAKQRMDAANIAHAPIRKAHEDALASKRVADARVNRLSALQTEALNKVASASKEARIGPRVDLRPRVATWAVARSQPVNAAVASRPEVIYSQLPPAPLQQTQIYSNRGLNVPGQYDVVPPLGNPRPPVPARRVPQNQYDAPDSPLRF